MSISALESIDTKQLLKLAHAAGMPLSPDDLDNLIRRQLVVPLNGTQEFSRAHLYVLAMYYEAVKVYRHPWGAGSSDISLEDVRTIARQVNALLTGSTAPGQPEADHSLILEIERFLNTLDPFGPVSTIVDLLRPDVLVRLQGDGRLYAELRSVATAVAARLESEDAETEAEPLKVKRSNEPTDFTTTVEATAVRRESVTPPDGLDEARQSESTRVKQAAPTTRKVAAPASETEPPPASNEASAASLEQASPPSPPTPEASTKPSAPSAKLPEDTSDEVPEDTSDELEGDFEAEKTAEIRLPVDGPREERPPQKADTTSPPPPGTKPPATRRTKNLMTRLEELRSRDKQAAVDRETLRESGEHELESQIEELNRLRETYLKAQDWEALAKLYRERIDLFEAPQERQQIHLALATIYEAKLDQTQEALERFIYAFETEGPARDKALEGARRLAVQEDLANAFYTWVLEFSERTDAETARQLQPDLAHALHRQGEDQRAFLTLASYLHQDPDSRVDAEGLDRLESYSLNLEPSELDSFFSDILEADPEDRVVELVGVRAGLNHLNRGESHHALRFFRQVLDIAPGNQVAFNNLSRIYENEENYLELAEFIESRIAHAESEEDVQRLQDDLERIRRLATAPDTAQPVRPLFEANPEDPDLLEKFLDHHREAGELAEAYGVLNRLYPELEAEAQRIAFKLALADIATTALAAPEEAEMHVNEALDLGGPSPEVLGALAQIHVANKNWMNAVSAIESLLATGTEGVPAERLVQWLELGIESAERAHRGEEKTLFVNSLNQLVTPD